MDFDCSEKLKKLPPYLFVEIDRKRKAARKQSGRASKPASSQLQPWLLAMPASSSAIGPHPSR